MFHNNYNLRNKHHTNEENQSANEESLSMDDQATTQTYDSMNNINSTPLKTTNTTTTEEDTRGLRMNLLENPEDSFVFRGFTKNDIDDAQTQSEMATFNRQLLSKQNQADGRSEREKEKEENTADITSSGDALLFSNELSIDHASPRPRPVDSLRTQTALAPVLTNKATEFENTTITNGNQNETLLLQIASLISGLKNDMTETIENKMDEANKKLENKITETNTKLENKITETNTKLENKITETNTKLENKMTETIENKMDEANKKLENKMTETNAKLNLRFDDMEERVHKSNENFCYYAKQIEEKFHDLHLNYEVLSSEVSGIQKVQLEQFRQIQTFEVKYNELSQEMKIQHQDIRNGIKNDLAELTHNIDEKMTNHIEVHQKDMYMYQKEMNNKLEENKKQVLDEILPITKRQDEGLNHIKEMIYTQDDRIGHIEKQFQKQGPVSQPHIHVTCTGGNNHMLDPNPPKFYGRTQNPKEFLTKLKKFYEKSTILQGQSQEEHLRDMIDICMEAHASKWYSLIKEDIKKWVDFEDMFMRKYWSKEVQRGVKHNIELGKYRTGGSLSRAEYFIERVLILRSISPPLPEEEIVNILAEHFSELIQDARRVQNIDNVTNFELLLQREDMKDIHRTSRNNGEGRNERELQRPLYPVRIPNSPPRNQHQQHRYPAYQQRPMQPFQRNEHNHRREFDNRREYRNNQHPYHRDNPPAGRRDYQQNVNNKQYPTREQAKICRTIVERKDGPTQHDNPSSNDNSNVSLNC